MKRPIVIGLLVVALLFVLAGIGVVTLFTLRSADFGVFNVPLVSATVEESKMLKIDAEQPVTLNVDNDAGEVTVVGADVEAVEVQIVKTAYASTESGAETDLQNLKVDVKQNGNVISLTYTVSGRQQHQVDTVDFIISLPSDAIVEVETSFGGVDVSNIQGAVDIVNNFGDVTVENIEGALSVKNDGGKVNVSAVKAGSETVELYSGFGQVVVEQVSGGDITVTSNSGTIKLNNVRASGEMTVQTDFGDVTFENGSAASLSVETKSGKASIIKVNIKDLLKVSNDFGEITLSQALAGSYDLKTNSGAISVDGAKGKLKAHTDFGNIEIKNAQSVTLDIKTNSGTIEFSGSLGEGPHNVASDFGDIDLAIPADSKLNVDLKTDFGKITSDIPLTVTLDGNSEQSRQVGTMNGGGEQFTVKTNSGGISITAIK
jgi:DUF4097 and DUF4098 domain-containing protein YvlB